MQKIVCCTWCAPAVQQISEFSDLKLSSRTPHAQCAVNSKNNVRSFEHDQQNDYQLSWNSMEQMHVWLCQEEITKSVEFRQWEMHHNSVSGAVWTEKHILVERGLVKKLKPMHAIQRSSRHRMSPFLVSLFSSLIIVFFQAPSRLLHSNLHLHPPTNCSLSLRLLPLSRYLRQIPASLRLLVQQHGYLFHQQTHILDLLSHRYPCSRTIQLSNPPTTTVSMSRRSIFGTRHCCAVYCMHNSTNCASITTLR